MPPPPTMPPGDLAANNVVVPATRVPPAPQRHQRPRQHAAQERARVPSAAPGAPAPANPVSGAKAALPSTAPAGAAASDPVVPATRVTPAPPTAPGALGAGMGGYGAPPRSHHRRTRQSCGAVDAKGAVEADSQRRVSAILRWEGHRKHPSARRYYRLPAVFRVDSSPRRRASSNEVPRHWTYSNSGDPERRQPRPP